VPRGQTTKADRPLATRFFNPRKPPAAKLAACPGFGRFPGNGTFRRRLSQTSEGLTIVEWEALLPISNTLRVEGRRAWGRTGDCAPALGATTTTHVVIDERGDDRTDTFWCATARSRDERGWLARSGLIRGE